MQLGEKRDPLSVLTFFLEVPLKQLCSGTGIFYIFIRVATCACGVNDSTRALAAPELSEGV